VHEARICAKKRHPHLNHVGIVSGRFYWLDEVVVESAEVVVGVVVSVGISVVVDGEELSVSTAGDDADVVDARSKHLRLHIDDLFAKFQN
jgi:hypothetical protein